MKTTWMTMILAAAVATVPVLAGELKANIPFDFTAGSKHMTAGTYTLSKVPGKDSNFTLWVHNQQTRDSAVLISTVALANEALQEGSGKIVFQCSSGVCALAQVHQPGDSIGRLFPTATPKRGETERKVAIRLAAAGASAGF